MSADDYVSILNTYSRYGQAVTDRRYDDWVATFTEDAEVTNRFGHSKGREALRAAIAKRFDDAPTTKIVWCNPVIEIDGSEAHATTDYLVFEVDPSSPTGLRFAQMGRYTDVLRKQGDRWLIHLRLPVDLTKKGPER
jgi:hypothetical protein